MPSASLFDSLRRHAIENGAVVAAIDAVTSQACTAKPVNEETQGTNGHRRIGATITYSDLYEAAERLARVLAPQVFEQRTEGKSREPAEPVVATLMQRGCQWYCLFWAVVRLQVPLAALSMDLPDVVIERQRNVDMLATHQPVVLVLDTRGLASHSDVAKGFETVTWMFDTLWARAQPLSIDAFVLEPPSANATLCFSYTGGTTKASRCARITHRMALHELEAYPRIATLGSKDRVMQQHSLYWAASAYGEVDIALAFGCALVFCEAWDADAVAMTVRRYSITCAGLVPSVLAALQPEDVPSLQLVFTWGEELRAATAQTWARRLRLIDLLISTECWLSLYAEWGSGQGEHRPAFKVLPGVTIRLRSLSADQNDASDSVDKAAESGELLVSGPMVSPGYTDSVLTASAFEVDTEGRVWYCTKDCLKYQEDGLVFVGRADDLVKVGGVWVDVREIGARIATIPGVSDVCVSGRVAYVVLVGELRTGLLPSIREVLPPDLKLVLLPALRRNPGTGKVDRKWLSDINSPASMHTRESQETQLCIRHLDFLLVAYQPLLLIVFCSAVRMWLICVQTNVTKPYSFFCNFCWGLMQELFCRMLWLSYMLLSMWHLPPDWTQCLRDFPVGSLGLATFLCAVLPLFMCVALAGPGVLLAAWRGRLLSWPLVSAVAYAPWAREASYWLQGYGAISTAKWYAQSLRRRLPGLLAESLVAVGTSVVTPFHLARGARCCFFCQKFSHASKGRVDKLSTRPGDPPWYCNTCWVGYEEYKKRLALAAATESSSQPTNGQTQPHGHGNTNGGALLANGQTPPNQATHTFKPGEMGITYDDKGIVEEVKPDSQAHVKRICKGYEILKVGAENYSKGAVVTAEKSRAAYQITFKVSNGSTTTNYPPWFRPPLPGEWRSIFATSVMPTSTKRIRPQESVVDSEEPPQRRQRSVSSSLGSMHRQNVDAVDTQSTSTTNSELLAGSTLAGSGGHGRDRNDTMPMTGREAKAALPRKKSKEWKVIEKSASVSFESLSDPLSSLDSLRQTKITGALRREFGKRLHRESLRRSSTLGDLLDEIAQLPEEHQGQSQNPTCGGRSEFRAWGTMWSSKCQWLLRRDRPLSEGVLRSALARLMERHKAMRAELRDPYQLFTVTQNALTAFELWRRYGDRWFSTRVHCSYSSRVAQFCQRIITWSFVNAWPRVGVPHVAKDRQQLEAMVPLTIRPRAANLAEAEKKIWEDWGWRFTPPFQAIILPYGSEGCPGEGVLLRLIVTHMFSDGYSVVPLLSDLAHCVAAIEAQHESHVIPSLPRVPCMFTALEPRLVETIRGTARRGGITREPFQRSSRGGEQAQCVYANVPKEVVVAIRRAAVSLAIPEDVAVLTVICVALAWFENKKVETIAIIAPQRDGPSENDMVGLFADVRHLTVRTGEFSLAGLALQLHNIVGEREWQAPFLAEQSDVPFVNFEWTDFDETNGFAQHVDLGERTEFARHYLKVVIEQPSRDAWRICVSFELSRYGPRNRAHFFDLLSRAFKLLLDRPLEPLWPIT